MLRARDELLAVLRPGPAAGTWVTRLIHGDGSGSVRVLTDETGAVVNTRSYEAFGTKYAEAGGDPLAYGFAGEPLDPITRLAYHRARWMDPRMGRFHGMDPLVQTDDVLMRHQYAYANMNPSNRIDPTGLYADISAITIANTANMESTVQTLKAAGRSSSLGINKIENMGCSRKPESPQCNTVVLERELKRALFNVGLAPKGRSLLGKIRQVYLWQIQVWLGEKNRAQRMTGELWRVEWDPFAATRVDPYSNTTMMPGGWVRAETGYRSTLSPALGLAHELAHTLGLADEDANGALRADGPVPAWESVIGRQLRDLGFNEGVRNQYGTGVHVMVSHSDMVP